MRRHALSDQLPRGDQVKLLYAVGLFRRLYGFSVKKWPLRKFLADHSVSVYRRKLMVVAERRN